MDRNTKILLGVAVAVGVAYWLRNSLANSASANTRAVTNITSGANVNPNVKPVTSTPIKSPAWVAFRDGFRALLGATGGASESNAPSQNFRAPASAKLTPYASVTSARAAFTSPTATPVSNYRASSVIPQYVPTRIN